MYYSGHDMFFLFPTRPSRNFLSVFLYSRIYPVESVVNDRSHLLLWWSSAIVGEATIQQQPCFLALKATDNYRYDSIDFVVCPGFVRSVKTLTLQTTFLLWKMFIQLVTGQAARRKNPRTLNRSRTYDLLVTSPAILFHLKLQQETRRSQGD